MTQVLDAYMLDTHVFDDLLDKRLDPEVLSGKRLLVTGIQADEVQAMPDDKAERRAQLQKAIKTLAPALMPAASFAFDMREPASDRRTGMTVAEPSRIC